MILNIHLDASYLGAPNTKNNAAGQLSLRLLPQDKQPTKLNEFIHIISPFLKFDAASAADAEL